MGFDLPPEHLELQATVRRIAQDKVAPRAREIDTTAAYPQDLFDLFRQTGLLGLVISQPADIRFALSDFAYFTYLTAAASATALDRGYALVLTPSDIGLGAAVGVAVDGAIVVDPVEGDPLIEELRDASMPLVTTGRVKVFVTNPDRRNFEVASLAEGDFFGEISSLSGRPRTATVVAATTCASGPTVA